MSTTTTPRIAPLKRRELPGRLSINKHYRARGTSFRRMFRDIDADFYLMVDGDDTYGAIGLAID